MEWLRDWVIQIAGIIVLGAICDMIMPRGDMKKYVKLVIGMVLVFAIIRPITGISVDSIDLDLPYERQERLTDLQNKLSTKERDDILKLYSQKLEKSVANCVFTKWGCEAQVKVEVEEQNEEKFGRVQYIRIKLEDKGVATENEIKEYIGEVFDVNRNRIDIE